MQRIKSRLDCPKWDKDSLIPPRGKDLKIFMRSSYSLLHFLKWGSGQASVRGGCFMRAVWSGWGGACSLEQCYTGWQQAVGPCSLCRPPLAGSQQRSQCLGPQHDAAKMAGDFQRYWEQIWRIVYVNLMGFTYSEKITFIGIWYGCVKCNVNFWFFYFYFYCLRFKTNFPWNVTWHEQEYMCKLLEKHTENKALQNKLVTSGI